MSIIPEIPRPTIAPNRNSETRYTQSLHVTADEYIYGVGDYIRLLNFGQIGIPEVRIDGTVWSASTTNVSAAISGFYMNHIIITGTVVAEASEFNTSGISQGNAYAISNNSHGVTLTNTGTVFAVTDHGLAFAVDHWGPDVRIFNSGLIAAQTDDYGEVASTQALGIILRNGGFLHNQVGGQILAEGVNATGVFMARGELSSTRPDEANIINDGTIHAVALGDSRSTGIGVSNLAVEWMQIINNGLIDADVAIRTGSAAFPSKPSDVTITNSSTGIIRGDIEGDLGTETLLNSGHITGNIMLGEGDDVFDNANGTHDGWVTLDWGDDVFIGGISDERVDGGRMDDKLSGGGGNDLLLGGLGDDLIDGGAGNDGLYGDYGDDTFVIAGADLAFGGHGDDRFEVRDLGFALIDGEQGTDTLLLATITARLDLGDMWASGRVSGIETVDLGGSARGAIDAANAAALDGLVFTGGGAAELVLAGSWSAGGQSVRDGVTVTSYTSGAATIFVAASLGVSIVADMPTDTVDLDAIAGTAAPTLSAEPTFSLSDPVWNNAFYIVTDDTVVGEYEIWRAGPDNLSVTSAFAADATFTNYGRLEASDGRAVSVDILRNFTNHGTIVTQSTTAQGYASAFSANQNAPLFNFGNILAVSDGGLAEAVTLRAFTSGEDVGFLNNGSIRAEAPGGEAIGVFLLAGGTNSNSGEIYALGETRATAVFIDDEMHFTNSGTIISELTGEDRQNASAAIFVWTVFGSFELTNSGEITGEYAIRAEDTGYNFYQGNTAITNQTGGQINGRIVLSDTDDVLVNDGSIVGDVSLGEGSDRFVSRLGTFVGDIDTGGGVDWIFAGTGDHAIDGGSNVDTAAFSGNRADYTITQTALGVFEVASADGIDTLTNVEFLQFGDETIRLLRGDGVSVSFETDNPDTYQSAMNAIRDFDGNALGGDGSWLRIGSADVNGDGDVDQILVNDAIGRFATVGTAPDGLVYFEDYSWAGETRVAGIYIDPLVQTGQVVEGSDDDSQRRFQNDLQIENINRVLGADDYDGDGVWEVYFALTDGTAYLRALMHEDGNIRYANYQSEQEVIDYLTANGYDESTFGDWFPAATSAADTLTFVNEAPKFAEIETFERPVEFHSRPVDEWQVEYFG
jgi:hypothetical protein